MTKQINVLFKTQRHRKLLNKRLQLFVCVAQYTKSQVAIDNTVPANANWNVSWHMHNLTLKI